MSDEELVLDAIRRLPEEATLEDIRERVEFLAALKEGEDSLDRGRTVSQAEVERQFASWVKEWRSRSLGRNRRLQTSTR